MAGLVGAGVDCALWSKEDQVGGTCLPVVSVIWVDIPFDVRHGVGMARQRGGQVLLTPRDEVLALLLVV